MTLPNEFTNYLETDGDMEFETNYEFGGYIILEPLDLIEQFNTDIEISKHAPNYTAFTSDGGGEVFAFDKEGAIFLLPLIGMSPDDATKVAKSWNEYESNKMKMENKS